MKKVQEILKSNRERKRVSLDVIHQETRISLQYLKALESGAWNEFPAEVYCLGFLRRYSAHLGLDPEEMVRLYQTELNAVQAEKHEQDHKKRSIQKKEDSANVVRVIALSVLIFFLAGWWLYSLLHSQGKYRGVLHPDSSKHPLEGSFESHEAYLTLKAETSALVWIRVADGYNLLFEGFLPQGTTRSWNAQDKIFLSIEGLDSVQWSLNGRPLELKRNQGTSPYRFLLTPNTLLSTASPIHESSQ